MGKHVRNQLAFLWLRGGKWKISLHFILRSSLLWRGLRVACSLEGCKVVQPLLAHLRERVCAKTDWSLPWDVTLLYCCPHSRVSSDLLWRLNWAEFLTFPCRIYDNILWHIQGPFLLIYVSHFLFTCFCSPGHCPFSSLSLKDLINNLPRNLPWIPDHILTLFTSTLKMETGYVCETFVCL
jgi:hypothetical protein